MENKFYIDDFERFLKDKVEDFKMYPSHRVWHSIYNNMHPGSRWPSVSMCITLICTLFLIGYLNTGTTDRANSQVQAKKETATTSLIAANKQQVNSTNFSAANKQLNTTLNIPSSPSTTGNQVSNSEKFGASNGSSTTPSNLFISNKLNGSSIEDAGKNANAVDTKKDNTEIATETNEYNTDGITTAQVFDGMIINTIVNDNPGNLSLKKNVYHAKPVEKKKIDQEDNNKIAPVTITANQESKVLTVSKPVSQLSNTDKSWIENYAMYNRPAPKKWKGKLSMQVYLTPSVVYRNLKNTAGKNASQTLASAVNSSDIESFVTHTPSFGFETGTAAVYDLFKNVKIKAGVQLNYTRYNVHAYNNYHPTLTSLTMNSESNGLSYETYRGSSYSNFYGLDAVKLHSQTYQLSIPLGVDLRLAAINNIEWYAGASVQPSLIFGAKSYLLSTDTRNYVPGNEFLNRFNLNTGFETYLSFKTKGGYTWNIGPQLRKQIFSTSNKIYSIQERLVNYGIKFGISKKL